MQSTSEAKCLTEVIGGYNQDATEQEFLSSWWQAEFPMRYHSVLVSHMLFNIDAVNEYNVQDHVQSNEKRYM